ncbi:MAG TPA: peptidoglycan recognition family protein [Kribbella sp.]
MSQVEGAVIHWPGTGTSTPIHTQAAVASALRGWQDYHMDTRGWSDIAYQVAVDQAGRAWDLRGLRTQSGANGDTDVNERYGAILLVLVDDEEPTAAMAFTVRGVIADFRRLYPHGTAIRPHSAVRPEPTDCPGPAARAAIARGDFDPDTAPTPDHPTEDDDMWTPEQAEKIEKRYTLAHQLWLSQTAAERAVSDALAAQLLAKGMKPADAIKEVEKLWTGVQRTQAEALERLA